MLITLILILLVVVILVVLVKAFGYSDSLYKECVYASDEQIAIINYDCPDTKVYSTIKWFLNHNYTLDISVSDVETTSKVIMTR